MVRWILGVVLLFLTSQSLLTWPLGVAWYVGIGATEWGHWLFVLCLVVALFFGRRRETALVVLAGLIALLPGLRAFTQDGRLSFARLFTGVPVGAVERETFSFAPGLSLDVYHPPGVWPSRCVMMVHGGAWARGDRAEFGGLNPYLAERGYTVCAMDYRLAPGARYPAQLEDLDAARAFMASRGCREFVWIGRSAGGHLAMLECYRHGDRGVVGFYPPTDLAWSYEHPSNPRVLDSPRSLRDFLGGPPPAPVYVEASPYAFAGSLPPTLILHGGRDDLVFLEQSRRFVERHPSARLVVYPWANHGFDVNFSGPSGQLSTFEVEDFLRGLFPDGAAQSPGDVTARPPPARA